MSVFIWYLSGQVSYYVMLLIYTVLFLRVRVNILSKFGSGDMLANIWTHGSTVCIRMCVLFI